MSRIPRSWTLASTRIIRTTAPQCWYWRQYRRKHGLVNVSEALEVSCNVFFFDVGRRVGIQGLQEFAAKFGLGEPTGIELYEETGVMAGPEYTQSMGQTWYEGSTLSVAIGQESSQFTPLQLANYIATLVNGGTRYSAHLLKEVKSSDFSQVLYTYEPEVLDSIDIQPENLDAVKAGDAGPDHREGLFDAISRTFLSRWAPRPAPPR